MKTKVVLGAILIYFGWVGISYAPTASANLSITKTDSPDPVFLGQDLTYTITVSNAGPNTAQSVLVSDPMPAGVTFVSATPSQGSCSGASTVTCNLGSLANGASATVTIVVTPNSTGEISNTATVSSPTADPAPGNNSSTTSTTVNPATPASADLSVTKSDDPDPVDVGLSLTYTVIVTNNGPDTATNVTLTDTLPTDVNFVSATPTQGTCGAPSGGGFTCDLGILVNGASVTVTVVVQTTLAGLIGNSASVFADQTDPDFSNNVTGMVVTNVGDVSRLVNISTRGFVGTGSNVMVGGFTLGGTLPKQLLVRGFGPTLTSFGIAGVLADPIFELFWDDDSNPSTPAVLLASNNDWGTPVTICNSPAVCGSPTEIEATGLSANSYAPTNPDRHLDAALLVTLPPGAYTVRMSGVSNGTGIGLVGVDDPDTSTLPKLVNISTRGRVESQIPMIGGFIIGAGTGSKTVLLRGFGPSLTSFGLTGVLSNPTFELYWDNDGNPNTPAVLVATNDDWGTPVSVCNAPATCGTPTDIFNTGMSADSYAPTNPDRGFDSALLVTLPPGVYTVRMTGVGGGTGVALVGVDELGP